jgi:hypothetical protein
MEVSGKLHAPATLPLGKNPTTHGIGGWMGLEPVWTIFRRAKSLAPAGIQASYHPTCSLVTIQTTIAQLMAKGIF